MEILLISGANAMFLHAVIWMVLTKILVLGSQRDTLLSDTTAITSKILIS